MFDIMSVLVEADTYCVSCFSYVLEFTSETADQVDTVLRIDACVPFSGENIPIVLVPGQRNKIIKIRESSESGLRQGAQFGPHQEVSNIFVSPVGGDDAITRKVSGRVEEMLEVRPDQSGQASGRGGGGCDKGDALPLERRTCEFKGFKGETAGRLRISPKGEGVKQNFNCFPEVCSSGAYALKAQELRFKEPRERVPRVEAARM